VRTCRMSSANECWTASALERSAIGHGHADRSLEGFLPSLLAEF